MKNLLKTAITLTAIGVAVKVVRKNPERIKSGNFSGESLRVINSNHKSLS